MKKLIKILASIIFTAIFALAAPINHETAERLAENWLSFYGDAQYELAELFPFSENGITYHYFAAMSPSGFVIVAGDDRLSPVIGYSFEGNYGAPDFHPSLQEHLAIFKADLDYALENQLIPNAETKALWTVYSGDAKLPETKDEKDVNPLIRTKWNQNYPYNALCPEDVAGPGGHVYAGCVATAMAQAMRYWEHPARGVGGHRYQHSTYGSIQADFDTLYDWANMPMTAGSNVNIPIALLQFHCGVSVNMNYSPEGSGAYVGEGQINSVNSFKTYFGYSQNTHYRYKSNYTAVNWKEFIREELDNLRPLVYVGYGSGGHAFNLDGYQGDDHFHFNWGWGGAYDGYYLLTEMNPGGSNFVEGQAAIFGLVPDIVARFSMDKNEGAAPLTVQFTDKSSSDEPIVSRYWDFDNDGVIDDSTANPVFTYDSAGVYAVRLIVTDSEKSDTTIVSNAIQVYSYFGPVWYVNQNTEDIESADGSELLPFTKIKDALTMSRSGHSIFIAPGVYKEAVTISGKELTIASYYLLESDPAFIENTIIDGEGKRSAVVFDVPEDITPTLIGLTIQNGKGSGYQGGGITLNANSKAILSDLIIRNNSATSGGGIQIGANATPTLQNIRITENSAMNGGGIYLSGAAPHIKYCEIQNNIAVNGGGIYMRSGANPLFERTLIADNEASLNYGGGVFAAYDSRPVFSYTTITSNTAEQKTGGGLYLIAGAYPIVFNSIVWNNSPNSVAGANVGDPSELSISNSIFENYSDTLQIENGEIVKIDSVWTSDPLFLNESLGNYYLQENSPAIDKGLTYLEIDNTPLYDNGALPYEGEKPDLGAYEYDPTMLDVSFETALPGEFILHSAYPNPFNPQITIPFSIPTRAHVRLEIYNLKGQIVNRLLNTQLDANYYKPVWNGTNQYQQTVSSGVYILRLTAESDSQFYQSSKKVVFLR
jgi:PKD repeat protein